MNMSLFDSARAALDSVFLCVACAADGNVRVSVSRQPARSIIGRKSSSQVSAGQWAWIGSESRGKLLERRLRKQWRARYRPGEGFRFDYATEGGLFREELARAFQDVVGHAPDWVKLGPERLALIREITKG